MKPRAPVLLAVDDDPETLGRIERQLLRRYGGDYRIVCETAAAAAIADLERLRDDGDDVALVLADQWLGRASGSELLGRIRSLHPHAKRGLLIDWGAWAHDATTQAILQAMALGRIDYYLVKPAHDRDEQFHRVITEFLHEWTRERSADAYELILVGDPRAPRTHELRDLLRRNGVAHGFHPAGSKAAERALHGTGAEHASDPVVVLHDGRTYVNPTNEEIASAFGVATELEEASEFDVVVVGAGPAGLSAAVYASSEGLRTLVVEQESIGGQAGSSSLIRNYLGFARGVGGGELAQRAYQQAWVFGTRFLMMRRAVRLEPGTTTHRLVVDGVGAVEVPAVILATGVSYRRLGVPALEELSGAGVFYGASTVEAQGLADEQVFVVGGGNSAGQAALHLARSAGRVTLLIRGEELERDMSSYLAETVVATPNIEVRTRTRVTGGGGEGHLEWLELHDAGSGETARVPAAALFILIGARPHTDWLPDVIERDEAGYLLTGRDLGRRGDHGQPAHAMFETSVHGIFAVGDVRHGSIKRVAAAVGEGSVVVRQIHECLRAEAAGPGAGAGRDREVATWR